LLDRDRTRENRLFWQLVNTLGPLLLVLAAGAVLMIVRKMKYAELQV
jgi:ABC-2 type transport system permease protein